MRLLAVDTCGPEIGVALWDDGLLDVRTQRVSRGAESLLVPWAMELAGLHGLRLDQLDGVGVARGPGAFTGIRVGLAMALGLSTATGVPVLAVDSLRSRAAAHEGPILSMLDARKSRVYAAHFVDGVALGEAVDELPERVLEPLPAGFVATGEGAEVYRALVEQCGGRVAEGATSCAVGTLARLAAQELAEGRGQAPALVRPVYLRAPDAVPPKQR